MSSKKSSGRSEMLNDVIRKTRETDAIRKRLKLAETSAKEHGWVTRTADEILDGFGIHQPGKGRRKPAPAKAEA